MISVTKHEPGKKIDLTRLNLVQIQHTHFPPPTQSMRRKIKTNGYLALAGRRSLCLLTIVEIGHCIVAVLVLTQHNQYTMLE